MKLTLQLEDLQDALKLGAISPIVEEAQKTVHIKRGTVEVVEYGTKIGIYNDLGKLNQFFVSLGDVDTIRTDFIMRMEAFNLVGDMLASSPTSTTFTTGTKKNGYKRIFIDEIEKRKAILFDSTDEFIEFGLSSETKCKIEYLESK
ncbi:hypothetical protein [Cerasicoccus fimbriatus]|uniref:hypothetical protein n=1 Tax=Cerasicoccus fimbriatus TaxID=3014554 RepID=UPI0022B3E7B4|nr:hypothetical protein [Cerasicoccus sp. TK19100]